MLHNSQSSIHPTSFDRISNVQNDTLIQSPPQLFEGCRAIIESRSIDSNIATIFKNNGGKIDYRVTKKISWFITSETRVFENSTLPTRLQKAIDLGIKLVKPSFIEDSVSSNKRLSTLPYEIDVENIHHHNTPITTPPNDNTLSSPLTQTTSPNIPKKQEKNDFFPLKKRILASRYSPTNGTINSSSTSPYSTTKTPDQANFTTSPPNTVDSHSTVTTTLSTSTVTTPSNSTIKTAPTTSTVTTTPSKSTIKTTPSKSTIKTTPSNSTIKTTPSNSTVTTTPSKKKKRRGRPKKSSLNGSTHITSPQSKVSKKKHRRMVDIVADEGMSIVVGPPGNPFSEESITDLDLSRSQNNMIKRLMNNLGIDIVTARKYLFDSNWSFSGALEQYEKEHSETNSVDGSLKRGRESDDSMTDSDSGSLKRRRLTIDMEAPLQNGLDAMNANSTSSSEASETFVQEYRFN